MDPKVEGLPVLLVCWSVLPPPAEASFQPYQLPSICPLKRQERMWAAVLSSLQPLAPKAHTGIFRRPFGLFNYLPLGPQTAGDRGTSKEGPDSSESQVAQNSRPLYPKEAIEVWAIITSSWLSR